MAMTRPTTPLRVAIFANIRKPGVRELVDQSRAWIGDKARITRIETDGPQSDIRDVPADLLVVFGGDGTLLSIGRALHGRRVPVVGVNQGKVGYMAEFTVEDFRAQLDYLLDGRFAVTSRVLLGYKVQSASLGVYSALAVNDVVIHAGEPFRMIEMSLRVLGQDFAQIRGDGLIVASPTGSTAYNLSAGGPIVAPSVSGLVLTPICTHSLTNRPVVVGPDDRVEVHLPVVNPGTTLIIDGQTSRKLSQNDCISVECSDERFDLVDNPRHNRWHTLRAKLSWSQM